MSGLTLGLLSLDPNSLNILRMAGTSKEKKYANRILPIIQHHHLLLVTLLLANAVAVEAMPLFMDKISNEITAIVVSVTAVLIFGEVLPQAICSRYGLAVGALLAPFVYFLMGVFFLISWPMSKLLDCLLGKDHTTFFRRAEIKALVDLHGPDTKNVKDPLSYDEVLIIKGAMEMRDKVAKDAMIPIESVFMLDVHTNLDETAIEKILQAAYSRVPIYENSKHNILGVLLIKTLIGLNTAEAMPVKQVIANRHCFREIFCVASTTPLYDLLNEFQKGKGHLALVYEAYDEIVDETIEHPGRHSPIKKGTPTSAIETVTPSSGFGEEPMGQPIGIITLEDVLEELLCEEIVDETDVYVDVHKRVLVARARASVMGTPSSNRGRSVPASRQISSLRGAESHQPKAVDRSKSAQAGSRRISSDVPDESIVESDDITPLIS